MNSKTIATSAGIVEYSLHGKGIPILVVHGGHSDSNETFCMKGFDLDRFKFIIPSRPGYGLTPLSENGSVEKTAELLEALLDKLNIDKVIVYGISTGGPTAIKLAASSNKVKKLILASAITKEWVDKNGAAYQRTIKSFNPKLEKFTLKISKFLSKFNQEAVMNGLYRQYTRVPKEFLDNETKKELTETLDLYKTKQGFVNDIQQIINPELLSQIKCPTLILHCEYDGNIPMSHATYACRNIKNSTFRIVKNKWGHMIWLGDEASTTTNRIIEFIRNK